MDSTKYNEIIQSWMQAVEENCMLDAELTLKYCNDIIQYGIKTKDESLLAFGYYYCAVVYYVLNDGVHFFEAITNALSYLSKVEEWEMMARGYNFLGITAMSRGNAVIASDYYSDAMKYAKKSGNEELSYTFAINVGALNIICGRYEEAIEVLMPVYEFFKENADALHRVDYILALYSNLAKANLCCGRLKEAKNYFDCIHQEYGENDGSYTMVTILCAEALYYHIMGDEENCEKLIAYIHKATTSNVPIMDMFEDYYDYCKMLLDRNKAEEFWHIIDIMEPLVKSLNFTNLQLKLISLKIKFYRKHGKSAEYLQAAGLYYELSELSETETRMMMNNVLNLRKSLENVKKENERLLVKSETDPLTKLNNRFRMNDYSETIFRKCLEKGVSLTVEILDIDDFKGYNDSKGHQKGDECLMMLGEVLRSMEKEHGAFAARYGGDEFILIYEDITREQAIQYAEELRSKVFQMALPFENSPVSSVVTITQGLCWDIPIPGNRIWDYLHAADDMLYRMKQKQRNNYCIGNLKETEDQIIMSC